MKFFYQRFEFFDSERTYMCNVYIYIMKLLIKLFEKKQTKKLDEHYSVQSFGFTFYIHVYS